jgi:ABC-type multidrug transport system fused ATPase/permease subunit
MRKFFVRQQRILGVVNGHVEEMVSGYRTVVAYNRQQQAVQDFNATSDRLKKTAIFANIFGGFMGPVMNFISNVGFLLIAIVGATGSGKTTVVNLLTRFYDIDSGSITVDGIPINEIPRSDLRKSLAIVLQDTVLFSDTIARNIGYSRPDATMEEIMAAAEATGYLPFGIPTKSW